MKKFLILLSLFVLTGCSNELVCTLKTTEENYESEINVVFEFKKDKIVNAYSTNIMTFETETEAKRYFKYFEGLDEEYSVSQKNEYQIEVSVSKEYEKYNNDKEKIIEEFENLDYSCTQ